MKRSFSGILAICCSGVLLQAQVDSVALRYGATITEAELMEHLTIIAGDAFQGRDTGKEGQKMAAAYLKASFMASGIGPVPAPNQGHITEGYFQPFEVIESTPGTISLMQNERSFHFPQEIIYFQETLAENLQVEEVVYVPSSLKLPDQGLHGKVVLIDAEDLGLGLSLVERLRPRIEEVRASGAKLVLVNSKGLDELRGLLHADGAQMRLAEQEKRSTPTERQGQVILLERSTIHRMIGKVAWKKLERKRRMKRISTNLEVRVASGERKLTTENVLAYIEGTDKKDELVVLTAHYDHVGVKEGVVYNGADDDGTGTVAMIEIAEAFAQAQRDGHGPRRSVLVMAVSGEEKGLLGSRYYSEDPVFPLSHTIADLNIDMIGRRDSAHANSTPYIYVIGSNRLSSGLHEANERANSTYTKLDLDYTFNAENDPNRFYYRSDHYNFARKGIPSVFYFSGIHEDYHQPGDDVEKIDGGLLHQRTLLAFHTAWILANQEQRIGVDRPLESR